MTRVFVRPPRTCREHQPALQPSELTRLPPVSPGKRPGRLAALRAHGWLRAIVFAFATLITGCAARTPARDFPGCGADRDCKLDRICEQGRCVWVKPPVSAPATTPDAAVGRAAVDADVDGAPSQGGPDLDPAVTMFRFEPRHRGRVPFLLPEQVPDVVWKHATGGPVTSSPALGADGSVAVGSHDGFVYVLDPSGRLRSRHATGDLIFGSPAIDARGNVIIGSGDDHLYKLDVERDKLAWRVKLGDCRATRGVGPEASRCDVDGGPTVAADGTIYAGGAGVFALGPDGGLKWHFATPRRIPVAPTIHPDGFILAGGHDDTLYAISFEGEKLWDFRAGDDIESSAAVGDDGTIYFGSDDNKIYALTATGELLWSFVTGDDVRASPAIGRNGDVLVGSFDGLFYAIKPDGTLAWSFRTGDRIVSSALVDARGAMLFGAQDDRLYALEPDGALKWSYELGGDIDSSPTLGPEGMIYVGSDDRNLYALKGE